MVAIKICGIDRAETLGMSITAGASHVGLVFFPPSPRNLSHSAARELSEQAQGHIQRVGLFVDPDDAELAQAVETGLDVIQLHGKESPQRVAEVRTRFGLPVWKVLSVASTKDIAGAERYHGAANFLLFDAKTPADAALPGGMGLRFDWSLLSGYRGRTPWGLAGGLTPGNVADAIAQTGAALVDTSSGVESAPGLKDVDKIAAFCKAAQL